LNLLATDEATHDVCWSASEKVTSPGLVRLHFDDTLRSVFVSREKAEGIFFVISKRHEVTGHISPLISFGIFDFSLGKSAPDTVNRLKNRG